MQELHSDISLLADSAANIACSVSYEEVVSTTVQMFTVPLNEAPGIMQAMCQQHTTRPIRRTDNMTPRHPASREMIMKMVKIKKVKMNMKIHESGNGNETENEI